MDMNFLEFTCKYKAVKGKLQQRPFNVIPRIYPSYPFNPKGINYANYIKHNLLKFKPWKDSTNNVCSIAEVNDIAYVAEWQTFLESAYAKTHVPNWYEKFHDVLENIDQSSDEFPENCDVKQEEWMILLDYHNSSENFCSKETINETFNWHIDSLKYSHEQIGSMPNWIKTKRKNDTFPGSIDVQLIDPDTFSEKQKLAYDSFQPC